MNKYILLTFVLLLLLFPATVQAWNSQTHQLLVENVYYSMPLSLQEKLNLTLMKKGSTDPDLVFHDTVNHHYPDTLNLAYKYLEKIKTLDDFSYNFGVAAHYISDSFVAPHNIQKEDSQLHSKFEKQVNGYAIKTNCANYNYTLEDLYLGTKNEGDWHIWLENQDKAIPQKELEQTQEFIYSIAMQKINYECNSQLIYEEKSILPDIQQIEFPEIPNKEVSYPILLAVTAIFLFYKLFKKRRKIIALTILILIVYLVYRYLSQIII